MIIQEVSRANLPTNWGSFIIIGFEEIYNKKNHIALVYGINNFNKTSVLTRIHSECLTGDVFSSLRCDCGPQLQLSLSKITKEKCGILIYHRQEGRNIGLINKIKAYYYQDYGLDTIQANHKLGFNNDERNYIICAEILKILGIYNIKLLTNNMNKIYSLQQAGINVIKRIPLIIKPNQYSFKYLYTKKYKMGHIL
ncbi:GTP cyclohydrolase II [Enterobacteriaceae endosymbiont of Neohaemonia nigricornis]|uniref:GTP cyclohydrolase II n=1 Tax=Enterobacteriaceae endosymbiont of Neohaemonia nigricornis TaxID=2675792 RepID=UPI001449147F|nr:GTP cyclohydrolase II [Enterobacteriaceae endosymbiont of Neohaemonia nigricornis]QJC30539.1 GTP cyclohydrolase II [Enterobacteriaceae endosymbiont of Neohaemonia nigricornis]